MLNSKELWATPKILLSQVSYFYHDGPHINSYTCITSEEGNPIWIHFLHANIGEVSTGPRSLLVCLWVSVPKKAEAGACLIHGSQLQLIKRQKKLAKHWDESHETYFSEFHHRCCNTFCRKGDWTLKKTVTGIQISHFSDKHMLTSFKSEKYQEKRNMQFS